MIFPRKSRMPVRVQQRLLEQFVAGTTARTAAKLVGVQGRTAVVFFQRLRQLVASKQEPIRVSVEVEANQSDLRIGQRRGRVRRPAETIPVFGLLARDGKIYTAIITDVKAKAATAAVSEPVTPDGVVYAPRALASDVLNVSDFHYRCIKPGKTVLSRHGFHINGIENFWNESRRYLRRFHGISKTSLSSYLKECEWRFNGSDHRALSQQLKYWYQAGRKKA
jgi:transposase